MVAGAHASFNNEQQQCFFILFGQRASLPFSRNNDSQTKKKKNELEIQTFSLSLQLTIEFK